MLMKKREQRRQEKGLETIETSVNVKSQGADSTEWHIGLIWVIGSLWMSQVPATAQHFVYPTIEQPQAISIMFTHTNTRLDTHTHMNINIIYSVSSFVYEL